MLGKVFHGLGIGLGVTAGGLLGLFYLTGQLIIVIAVFVGLSWLGEFASAAGWWPISIGICILQGVFGLGVLATVFSLLFGLGSLLLAGIVMGVRSLVRPVTARLRGAQSQNLMPMAEEEEDYDLT